MGTSYVLPVRLSLIVSVSAMTLPVTNVARCPPDRRARPGCLRQVAGLQGYGSRRGAIVPGPRPCSAGCRTEPRALPSAACGNTRITVDRPSAHSNNKLEGKSQKSEVRNILTLAIFFLDDELAGGLSVQARSSGH